MKAIVLVVSMVFCISGCTARSWYEGFRMQNEMSCEKLHGHERDECLGRAGMSYDEYQRQLREREQGR